MLGDSREFGEKFWLKFDAPRKDQPWFYGAMVETLRHTTAPRMLVNALDRAVAELKRLAM